MKQLSQYIRQQRNGVRSGAILSVFGACIVGYRITAPFRLQIVKYLYHRVQDVHLEAQILGLSYLRHGFGYASIPFTYWHFLCSFVPVSDDGYTYWIDSFPRDLTKQQSRLGT